MIYNTDNKYEKENFIARVKHLIDKGCKVELKEIKNLISTS